MGEIRSALDIALEKTAHIEGDAHGAENREIKNSGKRAAGEFLQHGDVSVLSKLLSGKTAEQARIALEGAASILLASVRIPAKKEDVESIARLGSAFGALLPGSGMEELFSQVGQIFSQYLQELERLEHALEDQFMPRLRAKQQELQKRYGQAVPMDIRQDPEYASALNKNVRALEQKYETVVQEVRARVREAAGIEE